MKNQQTPEFLTLAEAASLLRMSHRTLRRNLGEIPYVRVGRTIRIEKNALLRTAKGGEKCATWH